LRKLRKGQTIDKKQLKAHVSRDPIDNGEGRLNCDKTCPLVLAVARGRNHLVSKWLSVVGDVNSWELMGWGYRQPYSLAHMALDPQYPRMRHNVPLEDRLAIVDDLGERGADFNNTGSHALMGIYNNPPLAAGTLSGHLSWKEVCNVATPLRARALLYGAIPDTRGSCFGGVHLDREPKLVDLALKYFMERTRAGGKLRPVPAVKAVLKKAAGVKGIHLDKLSRKAASLNAKYVKIEAQIERHKAELQKYKSQKTKKAQANVRYLLNIIDEGQREIKIFKRKMRKF